MVQRLLVLSASLQNLTIIKKKQLGEFLPIFLNIFWFPKYIYIYIPFVPRGPRKWEQKLRIVACARWEFREFPF